MNLLKKSLYIFLILILILILIIYKKKETFISTNPDIFSLNIFDGKELFLIANNPKVSKKTKDFLNNYDFSNSLIVRFNGYKPIVKDYINGKTDIMIYRQHSVTI